MCKAQGPIPSTVETNNKGMFVQEEEPLVPCDWHSYKERTCLFLEMRTGRHDESMEAEFGEVWPSAKKCWPPPTAKGSRKKPLLEPLGAFILGLA